MSNKATRTIRRWWRRACRWRRRYVLLGREAEAESERLRRMQNTVDNLRRQYESRLARVTVTPEREYDEIRVAVYISGRAVRVEGIDGVVDYVAATVKKELEQ